MTSYDFKSKQQLDQLAKKRIHYKQWIKINIDFIIFYKWFIRYFNSLLSDRIYQHINSLMALPTNLAAKIKAIPMDPAVLATDLELSYLLSFSQNNITHQSLYLYPRQSYQSPLQQYQFADFQQSTYQQLVEETNKDIKTKNRQAVKSIRCGFKQFYSRISANVYNTALRFMARQKNQIQKRFTLAKQEDQFKIQALKGNNPSRWPESLRQFTTELGNLPWFAFSSDSSIFLNDFIDNAKNSIINHCKKVKVGSELQDQFKQILMLQIQAFLGVVLRTNSQSFILQQLKFISEIDKYIELSVENQGQICEQIFRIMNKFFSMIPQESISKYHYPQSLWNKQPFLIMKKIHFQKYNGLAFYTITTDGKYLYIYISAINGGMYKIGTGQEGTKAGKIYAEKNVHFPIGTKVDEVNWVYLKDKLYLKTSSRDPWLLQVISIQDFKKQGCIQLFCPALFGQQSLVNLNKNNPILTDGSSLFYLGSRIKISKTDQTEKSPLKDNKQPEKQKPNQQKKGGQNANPKKKKLKKNQNNTSNQPADEPKNQHYQKTLEIVLYQFSFQGKKTYNYDDIDQKDIEELYDSFSGYFTKEECMRAFYLNNYDLAETCQWLFNEGEKEKERNIKVYEHYDFIILAELEITSNFQEKSIKGPNQIAVKEGSTLTISNLTESIWTMDFEHVTCFAENGVKIFSKDKRNTKMNPQTKLSSTLLKTLQSKFPKNPEYNVIYDPYHYLFYTFAWPQEGHYFPAVVLISGDKKYSIKAQEQRKFNAQIQTVTKLSQISKLVLHHMNLLDKSAIKNKYRFNDWLWFYGQKIIEIGNEMNLPESDKKRLSNKRTKILAKMNKINEYEKIYEKDRTNFTKNNKLVREIIKIFPFDSNGSVRSYKYIADAFKNLSQHPEQVYLYVLCLQNWLFNCSSSSNQETKIILNEIGQTLFKLKEVSSGKNKKYINRLILQEFYIFFSSFQKQINYLVSLDNEELRQFLKSQSVIQKRQKQSIIYEITKKDHLIQKFQVNKCQFAEIFKSKSSVNQNDNENRQFIANFLLNDLIKIENDCIVTKERIEENTKKRILDYIQRQILENEIGCKFIQFLFLNSFKMIHDNCKDPITFTKYLTELFTQTFKIFQKILSKIKSEQLFYILPSFLMVVELYHGSLIPLQPNQQLLSSLIKSLEYIQKPQLNQIFTAIEDIQFEGISPTTQKIYETSHPVERGKNYNFPPKYFNNASVLLVDLDKKCQSDSNDTLSIQILHEDTAVGNNIQINDGVFSSFMRLSGLSGAVDIKKPHLLLGNSCIIDYNSSGQVKQTQCLVKYGFRLGLRPIFAGKLKYSEKKAKLITKIFSNNHNFETFFNTLKFTTVAISNTIENYLHLQNEPVNQKISELLKGKIFKEGFQELNSYKLSKSINSIETITKFIQKGEHDSQDKTILRNGLKKYWNKTSQISPVVADNEELWNLQGVPSYIRGYLEQIKQFKGDFISVFTEARQMAKEKGSYMHIMRKKTFQEKHKQFWLQGEAILFLTILKHSGLLHLNLKFSIEYIKQNLKAFEDARDGIYYSFISRIQSVNQFRDLVQTYIGKQQPVEQQIKQAEQEKKVNNNSYKQILLKRKGKTVNTVKIGQKQKDKKVIKQKIQEKPISHTMNLVVFEKHLRQRLSQNDSLVKGICNIKNIKYDESNQFQTVGRILKEITSAAEKPLPSPESAYSEPIEHLIRSCLFLLKFKSPSTKQSLQSNEEIVPLGMGRSLSSDNRNVNENKLNIFREWLQNWKKWKGFKKQGRVQLRFPVEQIVKYINSWISYKQIEAVIFNRYQRCEHRIQFYSNNSQLIKLLTNNILVKYTLGTESLNLHRNYNSQLSSINSSKLKQLEESYKQFKSGLKIVENIYIEKLPTKLAKLEQVLKNRHHEFLQKIKLICHSLYLLESQNCNINLNVVLYFIPFKYINNSNEDLIYLSTLLTNLASICEYGNEEIVSLLRRQVGNSNIAYKRWKDFFFSERALFLLRKLETNCRKKVVYEQKIKISELLFYILYHVQIPLITRLSLKIIKKLDINLKAGIKTPLEYQYKLYSQSEKKELALKQTFKLTNNNKNNIELLCSKINNIFENESGNELSLKFDQSKHGQKKQEQKFNIILNLHQEEDLFWMIKVMYYIDQLEKKNGEKTIHQIKDWDEYLILKSRKRDNQKEPANNQNQKEKEKKDKEKPKEKGERIFVTLPKYKNVDSALEDELPIGWFYNYCNVFDENVEKSSPIYCSKIVKSNNNINALQNALKNAKNNKNNNQNNQNNTKKVWNTPIFTKLAKKYEEFNSKPIEEPKPQDSIEIKAEFIKTKNIINRFKKYFIEISIFIDNFSKNGYYLFREDITTARMNQICQLITAGSTNRLKDLPFDVKNNDVRNRLNVNEFVPNFTTKSKITIIKTKNYAYFETLLTNQNTLNGRPDASNAFYGNLGRKQFPLEDSKTYMPFQQFISIDQPVEQEGVQFGKQWIESNFSKMKKKYEKVYLHDYPNDTFYLGEGGIESGIRDNSLIQANDSSLVMQTACYEKIMTHPKNKVENQIQETELPQQLIQKIQKILQKGSISINNKKSIRQYLLLTFYLKKLKTFDLQFVSANISKQFAQKLFKFTSNLNSYKELSSYKQDIQKLILKLIDNEHQKLHIFGNYMPNDNFNDDIQDYFVPIKLERINSSNQVKQESIETHSYSKSKYLIKSTAPQIENNKLLMYWEKNILPKIYQFVKTTLKPLEIEDFWEQMRNPLRANNHTEAKRVAYIICDNKLPAGAIIPDANHNWNSLQVEEIYVGENVLINLPKSRGEFCTPLLGWGKQDHRLAKIIFIDIKNNSVLVRYRIEELALFSFTWVPVNALMAVEKQVMHISTQNIYEQLQKKIEGMIYIYSKQCLTKLASSVSERDSLKLIKQTILDLFITNPISGFFDFPKPQWSMRAVFEKMLEDKNYIVLDILQKEFCVIRGMDINLNSQKIINLNRFDDAKALIVSFKKDAKFSLCSGIKFFNDKYGYNEVAHVYTAKSERTDIQPLEFNQPNIYCAYYTNKDCLPLPQQINYQVYPIDATIFAIDDMWTIGCYVGDIICQIAINKSTLDYLVILERLNKTFINWILKKSVSVLCAYLAKLISKISMTITYICEKNAVEVSLQKFGISLDQLKDLIKWINRLTEQQSKEIVALYSSLLQNLSQVAASILLKLPNVNANQPEQIRSSIDLIKMFKEIDSFVKTKKLSLSISNNIPTYQWERILQISNIPDYFNKATILKKMKEIIHQNKGKVLCPEFDIFLHNNNCFILVDGWDINELVEEEVIEKIEQEEEKEQEQQEEVGMMSWTCLSCTFENAIGSPRCEVCDTAPPPMEKPKEVYDIVEATDLKAAEKKLKEREAKRFEEVKVQILKFFEDQYKAVCEKIEKQNKQITENSNKNKDVFKKNKKGNVQVPKEELQKIPEKPEVSLQTGSKIFDNPKIEQFLEARFKSFPSELKKLVEQDNTYLSKFKKFLNLGYDLWGDNIANQSATLIPFNALYLLMDYIQTDICKGSSSVLSYSQQSIRILSKIPLLDDVKPENESINYLTENDMGVRVKYKALAGLKSYNIRYSWKLIKDLNLAASKCLQFINMDIKFDKERNDTCPVFNDSLGYKIKYFRNLIMGVIKLELSQKIMQKTSVSRENQEIPKIQLERLKVKQQRTKDGLITLKQKEDHLFTKAHHQFTKISSAFLRPFKPKGADPYVSFIVQFKGQNVMGQAGPYRQFFTDIARQLDPVYNLGLFIKSPNNRHQSGQNKSKWVINPKANSTYHFNLFEFIGTLMGCCFRTGGHLALDLPLMFWKSITHEEITDQDLEQIDTQLVSMISMLKDCPSQEALIEATDATNGGPLTWAFKTCDDQEHQMIPNGKNITVEFADLNKYIEMLKLRKINETKLQVKSIIKGISQLVPLPYLHCLTGEQLKLTICGRPKVDVQLLKKHTKYSGGLNEESPRIKFFWQIMRELTEIDRLKIIRFCWGQQRLPVNSEQFERNNIRFMIKPMLSNIKNQDMALPKADTCFFNIELPDYSTKETMKYKIMQAVNFDNVSINADENMMSEDNPNMNVIDDQDEDYEEEQ